MVSTSDVEWGYRLFLCREPDHAFVANHAKANRTLSDLRDAFTSSVEFQTYIRGGDKPKVFRCVDCNARPFYANTKHLDAVEDYILCRYAPDASRNVTSGLRTGDTFVDIGAGIGWFSVLAAEQVGTSGRIYAFEPDRANFEALQKTIEARSLGGIISCVRAAVSDRNSFLALPNGERVPTIALDRYDLQGRVSMLRIGPVKDSKIIIDGSTSLIARDHPHIF